MLNEKPDGKKACCASRKYEVRGPVYTFWLIWGAHNMCPPANNNTYTN